MWNVERHVFIGYGQSSTVWSINKAVPYETSTLQLALAGATPNKFPVSCPPHKLAYRLGYALL